MLAFRKYFLALAVVMLTVAVASAAEQVPAFQCVANAGVPPIIRAEGIAELVGDVVLNCNGGFPAGYKDINGNVLGPAAIPLINVQIFLDTNVTSKLLDANDASEALLLIDEPRDADQKACLANTTCATQVPTPWAPAATYKNGAQNMFQGKRAGANSIVWLGVPIDAPGTTMTRVIRLTNVRANANQKGVSSTLVPASLTAYISATGTTSIPINNPQQIVAWIQQGLTFKVRNNVDDGGAPGLSQCSSQNKDLYNDTTKTNACTSFRLRYTEGFASSFKTRFTGGPLTGDNQNTPGNVFTSSESGFFVNANAGWSTLANNAGVASQGTRLRAVFNNVPAGVRLFVTLTNGADSAAGVAKLVNVATDGSGGYVETAQVTTLNKTGKCDWDLGQVGIAEVPVFGGTGIAVWEVTSTNALTVQTMDFGVVVAYPANTSNNLPGLGTATVNGMFAPVSTVVTASQIAPVPRFADTSSAVTAFSISQCITNILFPWVSQQGNFDTGLVIVNTSKDPWGHATEAGTCTVNYFGDTNGGAAPPAQTSAAVPGGDYVAWTLYGGGIKGMTATQGFQGYIIAQCKFRMAHGYAFISNLGDIKWAQGYLALIMDKGRYTRDDLSSAEFFGN